MELKAKQIQPLYALAMLTTGFRQEWPSLAACMSVASTPLVHTWERRKLHRLSQQLLSCGAARADRTVYGVLCVTLLGDAFWTGNCMTAAGAWPAVASWIHAPSTDRHRDPVHDHHVQLHCRGHAWAACMLSHFMTVQQVQGLVVTALRMAHQGLQGLHLSVVMLWPAGGTAARWMLASPTAGCPL